MPAPPRPAPLRGCPSPSTGGPLAPGGRRDGDRSRWRTLSERMFVVSRLALPLLSPLLFYVVLAILAHRPGLVSPPRGDGKLSSNCSNPSTCPSPIGGLHQGFCKVDIDRFGLTKQRADAHLRTPKQKLAIIGPRSVEARARQDCRDNIRPEGAVHTSPGWNPGYLRETLRRSFRTPAERRQNAGRTLEDARTLPRASPWAGMRCPVGTPGADPAFPIAGTPAPTTES